MKRMGNYRIGVGFISVLLLCGPVALKAGIKNFAFNGTISTVDDHGFLLDGSITNGTPFKGYYVFDTETANSNSNEDPTVATYRHTDPAFGIVVHAGSYVFRTHPQQVDFLIELVNRPGSDNYLLRSYINTCSQPLVVDHIAWQLDDPTGAALTDVILPTTPPNLVAFQSWSGLTIDGGSPLTTYFIQGHVEEITEVPAAIPEPPAATLGAAVEVKWPSELGYYYQVQFTDDLETWTNVGDPVLGDGETQSRFFPTDSNGQRVYRVEIANFSKWPD